VLDVPSAFSQLPPDVGDAAQPFWPTPQELQDGSGLRNNSNSGQGGIRALSALVLRGGRFFENLQLIVVGLIALSGCATHDSSKASPRPGSGIKEYQEMTKEAQTVVSAALNSLANVNAHTNDCPPNVRAALAHDLERLQVDSLRIRSRAQAIQARGDAYFADWSESIKQIPDPKVRDAAERHQPQLEQSFSRIKLASQQAGAAFKPFLAGVRQLHVDLENSPLAARSGSDNELLGTTREHGKEVLKQLSNITNELHEMTVLLMPAKSASTN